MYVQPCTVQSVPLPLSLAYMSRVGRPVLPAAVVLASLAAVHHGLDHGVFNPSNAAWEHLETEMGHQQHRPMHYTDVVRIVE